MCKEHWAALLSILGAAFWIPLLVVTIRGNTDYIEIPVRRDRFTDIATVIAFVGVFCAITAAVLLLL
jgi:hypothetical protein